MHAVRRACQAWATAANVAGMTRLVRPARRRLWAIAALLGLGWPGLASGAEAPAQTKIGAFVTSLSDIQESQRRFDITLWVWLLSPDSIGAVDPARMLEIINATAVDR